MSLRRAFVGGCLALLVTGCGAAHAPPPHRLTATEANELATMRLLNLSGGGAAVAARLSEGDGTLTLTGWIDWTRGAVYAAYRGSGPDSTGILQCTAQGVATRGGGGTATPTTAPPTAVPASGWRYRGYQPGSVVDQACQLLLQLSSDRPENASLLGQSDAVWLSRRKLDGAAADVLQGPAPTGQPSYAPGKGPIRYWIDITTGDLLRVEAEFSGTSTFSRIDLTHQRAPAFDILPSLAAG